MSSLPEPGTPDELRDLLRAGFLAVHVGEPAAARAIFSSLAALRPDSVVPHIGRAMAEQAAGRLDEAVRWLRDVALQEHPDNQDLKAFLGLTLVQAQLPAQAVPVLRSVGTGGSGSGAGARMAQALLAQLGAGGMATPAQTLRCSPHHPLTAQ